MFFLSFVYFRCSLNRKAKHVQFASRKVYRCLEVKIINSVECFCGRRGVLKGCLKGEAGGSRQNSEVGEFTEGVTGYFGVVSLKGVDEW